MSARSLVPNDGLETTGAVIIVVIVASVGKRFNGISALNETV